LKAGKGRYALAISMAMRIGLKLLIHAVSGLKSVIDD